MEQLHKNTPTHTVIIFSQFWGTHHFTTCLHGSCNHHHLIVSSLPCQRYTHTMTPSLRERWRTYQGYGCPVQQWLSSHSLCEEEEVVCSLCRLRIADAAGYPEIERRMWGFCYSWAPRRSLIFSDWDSIWINFSNRATFDRNKKIPKVFIFPALLLKTKQ